MGDAGVDGRRRAAAALALVHRHVGVLEQLLGAVGVAGEDRDADAGLDVELGARDGERLGEPGRELVGGLARRALGALAREVGHQQHELVAAAAREQPRLALGAAQAPGHAPQQPVAGRVPERVVDELEVVEVDQDQRHRAVAPPRARHGGAQARLELGAVRQAGQRVEERQLAQLGLGAHAVGDVLAGEHGDHAALRVGQRGGLPGDPPPLAAAGDHLALVVRDGLALGHQRLERLARRLAVLGRHDGVDPVRRPRARRPGRRAPAGRGG